MIATNTKKVAASTLGCKVNFYDTEVVLQKFINAGYQIVDFNDEADIYVVNTCSVTNAADKKSRQIVKRAKAKNPNSTVAAIGCASQICPENFKNIGADIVLGTTDREHLPILLQNDSSTIIERNGDKTRAFLKIQDGCNGFCTFCIIPHARGRSKSRDFDDCLNQAKKFVENGYKEIVVAGIHVESFGKDLTFLKEAKEHYLIKLLAEICELEGLERVRLSSVEPNIINSEFLDFMKKHPKFCNHLHISLQSGNNRILKKMNRKYTVEQYAQSLKLLREVSPEINITTDIIAGFPSETDDEHKETCKFIEEMQLSKLHVFPFSPKQGTPAANFEGQIPGSIKNQRVKELINLGEKLEYKYNSNFIDKTLDVLVESQNKEGYLNGKTRNYINVLFKGGGNLGALTNVRIDFASANGLFGESLEVI